MHGKCGKRKRQAEPRQRESAHGSRAESPEQWARMRDNLSSEKSAAFGRIQSVTERQRFNDRACVWCKMPVRDASGKNVRLNRKCPLALSQLPRPDTQEENRLKVGGPLARDMVANGISKTCSQQ